jgi:predicted permease
MWRNNYSAFRKRKNFRKIFFLEVGKLFLGPAIFSLTWKIFSLRGVVDFSEVIASSPQPKAGTLTAPSW